MERRSSLGHRGADENSRRPSELVTSCSSLVVVVPMQSVQKSVWLYAVSKKCALSRATSELVMLCVDRISFFGSLVW